MFNNRQVEQFVENLGLSYHWSRRGGKTNKIIVEDKIAFDPFSSWLTDLESEEKVHSIDEFKRRCESMAKK